MASVEVKMSFLRLQYSVFFLLINFATEKNMFNYQRKSLLKYVILVLTSTLTKGSPGSPYFIFHAKRIDCYEQRNTITFHPNELYIPNQHRRLTCHWICLGNL